MGREEYDDEIRADELREGDELHLTFIGGDEYVRVAELEGLPDGRIRWGGVAAGVAEVGDTVAADAMVWVRKR